MKISEDFNLVFSGFNKLDERAFLSNINYFAKKNKESAIKIYGKLLKEKNIDSQLKYLVVKSMGELKYNEFVPMVKQLLNRGDKIQIIYAAIAALVRINSIEAYKIIASYSLEKPVSDFKIPVEEGLNELFRKNRLFYHFDVFYRDRGYVKGVEKSGEFLANNLPDIYIKDILPCLSSKFYNIRCETLKILKLRPNSLYYIPIFNHFKSHALSVDDKFFLLLSESLMINASLSKLSSQIFHSLRERLKDLEGNKRLIFSIMLLKLNTPEMISEIIESYPKLDYEGKKLVLENLKLDNHPCYIDFIRRLLKEESSDNLPEKIMGILIYAQDFDYIFQVIKDERTRRKEILLEILLQFEPPRMDSYIKDFVHSSQEDRILYISLEYLLRNTADEYYEIIKNIFFSGVPNDIKTLIIRNLGNFSPDNRKTFIESIFKDIKVVNLFKKDFLHSLLELLNEKKFDRDSENLLLNKILIMMEESSIDEITDFIYFFDKYEVNNRKDFGLIIAELRLLQGMILKSGHKDDLVRSIHVLIRNIEKRTNLKGIPAK